MRLGRLAVPAAVGVVLLGGTTAVQDTVFRSKIEDKLTDSSHSALAKAGVADAKVSFAGRDGKVTAPSADAAVKAGGVVEDVTGVRTVHAFGPDGEVSLDGAAASRAGSDGHGAADASAGAGAASASASASASGSGSASGSASDSASGSADGAGTGESGSDGDSGTGAEPSSAASESPSGTQEAGAATAEERKAAQTKLSDLGRITFESDSDTPSAAGLKVVRDAAAVLKEYPGVSVRVEGYTDSAGSAAHGLALSERRAKRVAYELTKLGVDQDRLSWKGYGESRQIPGASAAANRRVEFVVTD